MFEKETLTPPLPVPGTVPTRWLGSVLEAYHIRFLNWARKKFKDRDFTSDG
jgi:hypothetical protein